MAKQKNKAGLRPDIDGKKTTAGLRPVTDGKKTKQGFALALHTTY